MRCPNCNYEYEDTINFCPNCGTKNQSESIPKEKRKFSKSTKVALFTVLAVIVVGGVAVFRVFENMKTPDKFIGYIQSGDEDAAQEIFNSKIVSSEKYGQQALQEAQIQMEDIVNAYYAGTATYEDANKMLEGYLPFYSDLTEEYQSRVEALYQSQANFQEAETLLAQGDYDGASSLYAQVIAEDSNYEPAQERLDECYDRVLEDIMETAEGLAAAEKYDDAIFNLTRGMERGLEEEDTALLEEKIEIYTQEEKDKELSEADMQKNAGNLEQSLALLSDYVKKWGDDADVSAKIAEVGALYEKNVEEQVRGLLEQKDVENARIAVKEGRTVLPDSEQLVALEEEVLEYYPIKLQDIYLFSSNLRGEREYIADPKDRYQNQYKEGFLYYDPGRNGADFESIEREEVYLLNGEYVRFTAIIAPSDIFGSRGYDARFTVYGDGIELFSTVVQRNSKAVDIDVNVTGIEKLQIAFYDGCNGVFLLAEPLLYKR